MPGQLPETNATTMSTIPPLRDGEARALLKVARETIAAQLAGRPLPEPDRVPARLLMHQGAFVTLHRSGELRGCIGLVAPDQPLVQAVTHCALSAAFDDPRFPPLDPAELDDVRIEISVLTPPVPVEQIDRIIPGRHGLMIQLGTQRGLLLPQVAIEHGWDARTFLGETCRKAGLQADAWERGAVLESFEAEVFSEGSLRDQG